VAPHPDQGVGRYRIQGPSRRTRRRARASTSRSSPKTRRSKGSAWSSARSIVERTPGWLMRHRRLVRDYEARLGNSEA